MNTKEFCKCPILSKGQRSKQAFDLDSKTYSDDSSLLLEIRPVLVALLFVGIDLRPKKQCGCKSPRSNKLDETAIRIMNYINHALMAVYAVEVLHRFIKSDHHRITNLANRALEVLLFLLRYVLYLKRQKVASVILGVSKLCNKLNLRSKYLTRNNIAITCSLAFAFGLLRYVLVYTSHAFRNSLNFRDYVWQHYDHLFPRAMPFYVYYLLAFLEYFIYMSLTLLPVYFAILFASISGAVRRILAAYKRTLKSHAVSYKELYDSHSEATVIVKKVNEGFSLVLFLAFGYHVTQLFLTIHLMFSSAAEIIFDVYMYSMLVLHSGLFLISTVFAAQIHKQMQDIKTTAGEMEYDVENFSSGKRILLMLKIQGSSSDSITLWNSISITKSFVFSALGVILTYGVLLSSLKG